MTELGPCTIFTDNRIQKWIEVDQALLAAMEATEAELKCLDENPPNPPIPVPRASMTPLTPLEVNTKTQYRLKAKLIQILIKEINELLTKARGGK